MKAKSEQDIVRLTTRAKFPYLIEITTPDNDVFRYCNSDDDITFEGNVFEASFFKITPPERTENSIKDAKLTISCIDQKWIERIRNHSRKARSTIRFVAVIQSESDGVQYAEAIDDVSFKLTNATWTNTTIQWTMKFDDLMEIKMPCQTLSSVVCPALF